MSDPYGFAAAGDDFAPALEDFEVDEDPRIWYVLARNRGELLGAFIFLPQSTICYEVHLALLPAARGLAAEALRGVIAWLFACSPARRIVGAVPAYNSLANWCAWRAGMEKYGENSRAIQKNGTLHSLVLWGVSKDN